MAAPVVTGTIALMLEANAALTPNAVKAILEYTAEARDGYDHLTQGAGFLNARGAVELVARVRGTGARRQSSSSDPVRWSRHIIWGNRRIAGGMLGARANAWKLGVTWGDARTPRGEADRLGRRRAATATLTASRRLGYAVQRRDARLIAVDRRAEPAIVESERCVPEVRRRRARRATAGAAVSGGARMKTLPTPARVYVGGVIALGAVLLLLFFPVQTFSQPGRLWLFGLLLFLSAITSVFKVNLPLTRSGSTMSVSYAVDFASLLLLGPNETMLVAAASAWSQCTFRMQGTQPAAPHALQHGVPGHHGAGRRARRITLLGGVPGPIVDLATLPKPLVGAATTYFVCQHAARSRRRSRCRRSQPIVKVWNENFLWSAPSYFVGAGAAAVATWIGRSDGRRTGWRRWPSRRST